MLCIAFIFIHFKINKGMIICYTYQLGNHTDTHSICYEINLILVTILWLKMCMINLSASSFLAICDVIISYNGVHNNVFCGFLLFLTFKCFIHTRISRFVVNVLCGFLLLFVHCRMTMLY